MQLVRVVTYRALRPLLPRVLNLHRLLNGAEIQRPQNNGLSHHSELCPHVILRALEPHLEAHNDAQLSGIYLDLSGFEYASGWAIPPPAHTYLKRTLATTELRADLITVSCRRRVQSDSAPRYIAHQQSACLAAWCNRGEDWAGAHQCRLPCDARAHFSESNHSLQQVTENTAALQFIGRTVREAPCFKREPSADFLLPSGVN